MMKILSALTVASLAVAVASGSVHAQNESPKLGALSKTAGKATIGVIGHSDFLPDRKDLHNARVIGLPDPLADRIVEHLVNSKRFVVVERKALRRAILEQRFGKKLSESYLDRTLEKAITDMNKAGELAEKRGPTMRHWTLACEAIGPPDQVDRAFNEGAAKLLNRYGGPALTADSSYGYPRFAISIFEKET